MTPPSKDILALGGVLALALAFVFALALRARRQREFRARVFEVLARVVARGLPLAPLFATAAGEFRGRQRRAVERMHAALMGGASLGDAFAGAGRSAFPRHVVGAVRAAEGTGGLPRLLEATAGDAVEMHDLRHRILLALLYPAVLLFLVWSIQGLALARLDEVRTSMEAEGGALLHDLAGGATQATLLAVPAGLAAWWLLRRLRLLPGARLRDAGRTLRSLAALVGAGVSFPDALRRCGRPQSARLLEQGEPVVVALAALRLPPAATARIAAAAPRAGLADTLAAAADDCARRQGDRIDRIVRWANPAAVVLTACLAGLVFAATFRMIEGIRLEVWPW